MKAMIIVVIMIVIQKSEVLAEMSVTVLFNKIRATIKIELLDSLYHISSYSSSYSSKL